MGEVKYVEDVMSGRFSTFPQVKHRTGMIISDALPPPPEKSGRRRGESERVFERFERGKERTVSRSLYGIKPTHTYMWVTPHVSWST